jgi:hypothetical protein
MADAEGGGTAMPLHDWKRVEAAIYHAFHHGWIEELARALNQGMLPSDYYALPEQQAAGFGPDVLTLQGRAPEQEEPVQESGQQGQQACLSGVRGQGV